MGPLKSFKKKASRLTRYIFDGRKKFRKRFGHYRTAAMTAATAARNRLLQQLFNVITTPTAAMRSTIEVSKNEEMEIYNTDKKKKGGYLE